MVTLNPPTFCVPPLFMARVFATPLLFEPRAQFVNTDHVLRRVFFGERDGVRGDVIEVSVRDEQRVDTLEGFPDSPGRPDCRPPRGRRESLQPRGSCKFKATVIIQPSGFHAPIILKSVACPRFLQIRVHAARRVAHPAATRICRRRRSLKEDLLRGGVAFTDDALTIAGQNIENKS